jgi:hypothetical protein
MSGSDLWLHSRCALKSAYVRDALPAQPVDATQVLNLSAGVSNPKVFRPKADVKSEQWNLSRRADSVEKVRSCEEPHFFRGAGALMEKLCEGAHMSTLTPNGAPCSPTTRHSIAEYWSRLIRRAFLLQLHF